jgi:3-methyladenine DNA glycosylase AlkC
MERGTKQAGQLRSRRTGRRPGAANYRPVALREITTGFSAEFADRPFLDISPGQVPATLQVWTGDEHYHLRRLCSQGKRPRLSWAQRLMCCPHDVGIPLLDRLFANPMRYITRWVANHVNDISKTDPHVALDTLERWRSLGHQRPRDMAM